MNATYKNNQQAPDCFTLLKLLPLCTQSFTQECRGRVWFSMKPGVYSQKVTCCHPCFTGRWPLSLNSLSVSVHSKCLCAFLPLYMLSLSRCCTYQRFLFLVCMCSFSTIWCCEHVRLCSLFMYMHIYFVKLIT